MGIQKIHLCKTHLPWVAVNHLLHLGIKDIYLGPSLPAFLSDDVLQLLVKEYNIHPISTPEQDLAPVSYTHLTLPTT